MNNKHKFISFIYTTLTVKTNKTNEDKLKKITPYLLFNSHNWYSLLWKCVAAQKVFQKTAV